MAKAKIPVLYVRKKGGPWKKVLPLKVEVSTNGQPVDAYTKEETDRLFATKTEVQAINNKIGEIDISLTKILEE